MSINVSQIKNDFNSVKMENYEQAGNVVAKNFSGAFNGINMQKDSNGNIVFS